MATSNSLAAISRKLCRNLLSNQKPYYQTAKSLFSTTPSTPDYNSDSLQEDLPPLNSDSLQEDLPPLNSDSESIPDNSTPSPSESSSTSSQTNEQHFPSSAILENGLDLGVYKAILVGQVGQSPIQKRLKNGKLMTLTTVGTGGIRNERIPFANEEPREYADRCNVQWHRVSIYPENLGNMLVKHAQPGTILYIEGNLETKVFLDQVSGLVKRIREIAVRRNGRVVFLGNDGEFKPPVNEMKGVGYF
ncbi:Single-stranded DNA-binding protein mitochondrial [Bienertia sinuspersici]